MKALRLSAAVCSLFLFGALVPSPSRAQAPSTTPGAPGVVEESRRVVLQGSTHPLARREFDAGIAPDNLPVERVLLVLKRTPQQQTELQKLLEAQQTKGSSTFHKWISPEEFGTRFGPTDEDLATLKNWLTSQGFSIRLLSPGRTTLEFSGTAGQVRNAFHTEIHRYLVKGQEHWANDRNVEIPAAFTSVVHRVLSLNNFSGHATTQPVRSFALSKASGSATPITPYVTLAGCNGTASCYGVGPADFATIYDVNPLYAAGTDGTGQTIAIASSSNILLRDTQNFRKLFNLPANDPQIMVIGPDPGIVPGVEGPTNLQVQWAGAIAKNATIELVVTQSTTATEGANLSAIAVVNGNLAPILTLNFTDCEPATGASGAQFYQGLWEQAAAEGITVVAPAGDTGAAGCANHFTEIAAGNEGGLVPGGLAVNAVAATAFNVAVGGTDFNQVGNWSQYWSASNDPTTSGSAKSYIPESTWNDSCAENGPNGCANPNISGSDLVAGGGGCSIFTATPAWQASTGACITTGARALPDVSLFAGDGNNGSFYLVCQGDANSNGDPSCNLNSPYLNIQGLGGTAASAAAFAGVMALVDQYNNGPQGNANYVVYPLAANASANAFHDVTAGSTSVACVAASFLDCSNQGTGYGIIADVDGAIWSASPGYDLATGLGSVDVNNLVTKWSSVNRVATSTTIVSTNPASLISGLNHGDPVGFQINVTPNVASANPPTGDVALMIQLPPPAGSTTPPPPFEADVFTPLVNGSISDTSCSPAPCSPSGITKKLPGGTYQVYAQYAGDSTFAPSKSMPVNVTVGQQTSQTKVQIEDFSNGPLNCFDSGITSNSGFESYGAVYYLRVVIDNVGDPEIPQTGCYLLVGNKSVPTGAVTLTDNGGPLGAGTYPLNGRGYVELPTEPVSLGQHTITASYSGDASYAASSSAPFSIPIQQANSLISLSASASLIGVGQSVTITATLFNSNHGSGFLPPSGTVTFLRADGSTLGTAPLGPNPNPSSTISSIAQLTITLTQPVTVSAQYGGDANYLGSVSAGTVTINTGLPNFTLSNSPAILALTAGQPDTATITVTPNLGFTGTVALSCPAASSLPLGMTCTISPTSVAPTSNGKPVAAVLTLTSQAPSIILASAKPLSREWMAVVASGGLAFAGIFLLGDPRRQRMALLPMAIVCVYACASCANLATPGTSHASQLSLTTSKVKAPEGSPVTFSAAISADHQVGGTVDFLDNGNPIAQGVALQVGRATFTTSSLVLGTHPITASYSGDGSTHSATTSTPLNQVITGSSQLQVTATSGNLTHTIQVQFSLN
jgi:Pro-kumamolisin, activation domain/Bacterial Ig-like domain (group 3)